MFESCPVSRENNFFCKINIDITRCINFRRRKNQPSCLLEQRFISFALLVAYSDSDCWSTIGMIFCINAKIPPCYISSLVHDIIMLTRAIYTAQKKSSILAKKSNTHRPVCLFFPEIHTPPLDEMQPNPCLRWQAKNTKEIKK